MGDRPIRQYIHALSGGKKTQDLECYDIYFVSCNWVDTRWQQYGTHLHINITQNDTMQRNTQNGTYITIRIHKLQN